MKRAYIYVLETAPPREVVDHTSFWRLNAMHGCVMGSCVVASQIIQFVVCPWGLLWRWSLPAAVWDGWRPLPHALLMYSFSTIFSSSSISTPKYLLFFLSSSTPSNFIVIELATIWLSSSVQYRQLTHGQFIFIWVDSVCNSTEVFLNSVT